MTRTARITRLALLVGGAGILASSCTVFADPDQSYSDSGEIGDVRTVRLDNPDGAVTVRSGDEPSIRRTVHYYDDEKPGRTYTENGDELVLSGCGYDFPGCYVDYTVTVPETANVTGDNDSGEVDLTGVSDVDIVADSGRVSLRRIGGNVTVGVDSGELWMDDVRGRVRAQAGSGRIEGSRIAGQDIQADADSGDVRLGLTDPKTVRVQVDSGRVELTVPRRTYRVDTQTDSSTPEVSVPTARNAERRITIGADSGQVSVHS